MTTTSTFAAFTATSPSLLRFASVSSSRSRGQSLLQLPVLVPGALCRLAMQGIRRRDDPSLQAAERGRALALASLGLPRRTRAPGESPDSRPALLEVTLEVSRAVTGGGGADGGDSRPQSTETAAGPSRLLATREVMTYRLSARAHSLTAEMWPPKEKARVLLFCP